MRARQRQTLVALLAGALVSGCESGSSESSAPISFSPPPAPAGTGFVALYAPPVDVVPYPNDLYNPTGTQRRSHPRLERRRLKPWRDR